MMRDCRGVLLVQLGTPDAPTPRAVRRYLAEFLSDRRVVDLPRLVWWPILYGLILPLRAPRSAHAYRSIWTSEGSPLLAIAKRQCIALRHELAARGHDVPVALGMRYGEPSITRALDELSRSGAGRIIVLPLYPQYSTTTTASVRDALDAALARGTGGREVAFIDRYHDDSAWIEAVAASIRAHRERQGAQAHLLMSFHGIPERTVRKGDPYPDECRVSARAIAARLGLVEGEWSLSFQSRFGPARWVGPYTETVLRELPARGVRAVDVVCPGFATDCLETLEEIAVRDRALFLGAGGREYRYIPALNDDPAHIAALAGVVLSGSFTRS